MDYDSRMSISFPITSQNCIAAVGHFDELRGKIIPQNPSNAPHSVAAHAALTGVWSQFFTQSDARSSADLDARFAHLQRQIRDNGVTYNVYADQEGPQRPWSLDLFPLLIDAPDWKRIETGIQQRMRLLESIMADVYGAQQFIQKGWLPPALIHANPGYLRAMHGVKPLGGVHLHVAAFDLAHGSDGNWWLMGQRCQAPSGLGYLLENRLAVSRQFPKAFEALKVQRLAGTYRALMESMRRAIPAGANAHIALLTPGPYNETYFEHAYLARYLGLSLVEGSDLTVRDEHLFLRTLRGLQPVHGLLKRLDDEYLDPLELRPDSTLGVPGLMQAIRAGNVLVANAPGSAFLESPALLGFLPALACNTLGEELTLPAVPTWWCGERRDLADDPLPHLSSHTVQEKIALSQMPVWQAGLLQVQNQGAMHLQMQMPGQMLARSVMLRVFAVSDGVDAQGQARWRVLPGGLARLAGGTGEIASMQRGGSSADVWALTDGAIDITTMLPQHLTPADVEQHKRIVTSRAAENLFWLGRYTERTENNVRQTRLMPLLQVDWTEARNNLHALKNAASAVRERLSQEHWNMIVHTELKMRSGDWESVSHYLAAITGAQTDRMTRDDGWRLLSIGRHIERLAFLASALQQGLKVKSLQTESGFETMLALFDSTITFRARYQQSRDMVALIDLLVLDRDNPRSLAWVAHTLRGRLSKLHGSPAGVLCPLSHTVPNPNEWNLARLCEPTLLNALLNHIQQSAYHVSDTISTTYFTHAQAVHTPS
ncbi:MAG: hypothetical protein RIR79_1663 [Pseudomonadota bacterium]|jgi:uncharacterized circularly permuted ATP-grasp superfamily protein/uncharacterized alpha-E superfamily protein